MAGKYNISSASARLRSSVHVNAFSPKDRPTCGMIMRKDQAIELVECAIRWARPVFASSLSALNTLFWGYGSRSPDVDPAELRLPSSRSSGADPVKLQQQIAKHGTSTAGMPPLLAYEGSDGALELYDGVTRATRVAKLLPGTSVQVEVIAKLKRPKAKNRRVGDAL